MPRTDRTDRAGSADASGSGSAAADATGPAASDARPGGSVAGPTASPATTTGAERLGGVREIEEIMARHRVPGVGIALIRNREVQWTAGFGVRRAAGTDSVTEATLFQAASISKPVAAAGVLRLVREGRLDLDADVAGVLRSWRLPSGPFAADEPVTLRRLLSHTAGVTVHGFPGYAHGDPVPGLRDLLNGAGPANSPPVRVDAVPGSLYRYSGGGYQIVELLVEEATGEPFDAAMRDLVLAPFGMERSTFGQPLPDSLSGRAAGAHGLDGAPIAGGWHTYPERAAAGLWTTPGELAGFLVRVMRAYRDEPETALDPETARLMLTVEGGGHGLGPMVGGTGNALRFGHGGSNRGYRAHMVAFPATGDGIVVMTNGDGGDGVIAEIVRRAARAYGWPE